MPGLDFFELEEVCGGGVDAPEDAAEDNSNDDMGLPPDEEPDVGLTWSLRTGGVFEDDESGVVAPLTMAIRSLELIPPWGSGFVSGILITLFELVDISSRSTMSSSRFSVLTPMLLLLLSTSIGSIEVPAASTRANGSMDPVPIDDRDDGRVVEDAADRGLDGDSGGAGFTTADVGFTLVLSENRDEVEPESSSSLSNEASSCSENCCADGFDAIANRPPFWWRIFTWEAKASILTDLPHRSQLTRISSSAFGHWPKMSISDRGNFITSSGFGEWLRLEVGVILVEHDVDDEVGGGLGDSASMSSTS